MSFETPYTSKDQKHNLALTIVFLLRSMLEADPIATTTMCNTRWQCSRRLADHPSVQVSDEPFVFGLLGVLNGILGVDEDGWGCIVMEVDKETGMVLGFEVMEEWL